MQHLFDITYIVTNFGYIGIIIIIFLESSVFFPLPGDSLIFTAGLLAPQMGFSVVTLIFITFLAVFFGGIVGYYIGIKLDFLYQYPFFRRIFKKEYLDEAHAFLETHGLYVMVMGRFIPVVRTFLPIVAGMVRMDYAKFLRYNFLGALAWSSVFVLGGYFLGHSLPQIQYYILYIVIIIVLLSLVPGLGHLVKKKTNEALEHAAK